MKAKSKVSAPPCSQQRRERVGRGREAKLDAVGDAGLLPVAAGDAGPFLADIAADELAVGRQRGCDRQRAVAGEGADLDRPARTDEFRQQREQRALVGADLHSSVRHARRLRAKPALHIGFVRDLLRNITLDCFGE